MRKQIQIKSRHFIYKKSNNHTPFHTFYKKQYGKQKTYRTALYRTSKYWKQYGKTFIKYKLTNDRIPKLFQSQLHLTSRPRTGLRQRYQRFNNRRPSNQVSLMNPMYVKSQTSKGIRNSENIQEILKTEFSLVFENEKKSKNEFENDNKTQKLFCSWKNNLKRLQKQKLKQKPYLNKYQDKRSKSVKHNRKVHNPNNFIKPGQTRNDPNNRFCKVRQKTTQQAKHIFKKYNRVIKRQFYLMKKRYQQDLRNRLKQVEQKKLDQKLKKVKK